MQDELTVRAAEGAEKAAKRVSSEGSWTGFCGGGIKRKRDSDLPLSCEHMNQYKST